jgi:hypothetical protein
MVGKFLCDWGDGEMGKWVVGSESVGRSLFERSFVISHWSLVEFEALSLVSELRS